MRKPESLSSRKSISIIVNGKKFELDVGNKPDEVSANHSLAHTLRETLGLTGTKISCNHGVCGSCTVLVDGQAMLSCMILTIECNDRKITTIEGLVDPKTGNLDPIQESFIQNTAFQCGFCTPGIIMSTKDLFNKNPNPSEEDIKEALSGNFCRCISHYQVVNAVIEASEKVR